METEYCHLVRWWRNQKDGEHGVTSLKCRWYFSPPCPWGNHQYPGLSGSTFPKHHRWGGTSLESNLSYNLTNGFSRSREYLFLDSMIRSDWRTILPFLYLCLEADKVLECFYTFPWQPYSAHHREGKVSCTNRSLSQG